MPGNIQRNTNQLPPLPLGKLDTNDTIWQLWFNRVRAQLDKPVAWQDIDFSNSKLTDIVTRQHNSLQNIDGAGTYHLTAGPATFLEGSSTGSYVPTVVGFTSGTTVTGKYSKVGNLCFVTITMANPSGINLTANGTISLPFPAIVGGVGNTTNYTIAGIITASSSTILFSIGGALGNTFIVQANYTIS